MRLPGAGKESWPPATSDLKEPGARKTHPVEWCHERGKTRQAPAEARRAGTREADIRCSIKHGPSRPLARSCRGHRAVDRHREGVRGDQRTEWLFRGRLSRWLRCERRLTRALAKPSGCPPEASTPPGDETPLDVGASASEGSAGVDATDAPSQGVSDGSVDALAEGGCGPLGTPANCSACGVACSTATGTPSCSGSACSYTCNSNLQDCNGAMAPDTDGCECAGTACCGLGCQTIHSSGVPSPANYYDCNPKGNTSQTQAMAACTGSGGASCSAKNASCGGVLGFGGDSDRRGVRHGGGHLLLLGLLRSERRPGAWRGGRLQHLLHFGLGVELIQSGSRSRSREPHPALSRWR